MSGRNHSRSGRSASWAKLVMGETRGYQCGTSLFCSMVFRLTLDRFTCCVHVTITDVNNLFPDFHYICMLWDLILTSYTINSLPVCCSTNKLVKTWLGKAKYCIHFNSKTKQKPATKIQHHVFLLH